MKLGTLPIFFLSFRMCAAAVDICPLYGEIYSKSIVPKVTSGIPFELMSMITQKESVLCKRVIHITYNLWDEMVSIDEGTEDRPLHKVPLKNAGDQICHDLNCNFTNERKNEKVTLKLLLNPMWSGRIARLKAAIPETSHILNIDWAQIAKEMPSEKELLVKDITP